MPIGRCPRRSRRRVILAAAAAPIVACCRAEQLTGGVARRRATAIRDPARRRADRPRRHRRCAARGYSTGARPGRDRHRPRVAAARRAGSLANDLSRCADALATQVRAHRATPLVGRTWLQQALPVTLGLKLAGTLAAIGRHRQRVATARSRIALLQFGGAAGTLASLGNRGAEVEKAIAADLGSPSRIHHGTRSATTCAKSPPRSA
jgi:3-carboxy-cis,cis-muconate cycloisomerase